jgi:hypothetical protein
MYSKSLFYRLVVELTKLYKSIIPPYGKLFREEFFSKNRE